MNDVLLHGIGGISALIVLYAYWAISTGRLHSKSLLYQTLNLISAIIALWYLWVLQAWMSVAVQAVWGLVALLALRSILAGRRP